MRLAIGIKEHSSNVPVRIEKYKDSMELINHENCNSKHLQGIVAFLLVTMF